MTRKALGRGLSALLSADESAIGAEERFELDVGLLDPSPVQPRSHFDEKSLDDLAASIRENGVVQPVLVRPKGTRFELIAGERRWRAAQRAGLKRIPAVVRAVPDDKLLELALIENIQREDLNAIEEAHAYKKLIETIGLTQESLAQRLGRDRSYITNHIRLLRLPDDLQRLVQEGTLSSGHARTLLGVNDVDVQRRMARKIIDRELSVRETERAVKAIVERRGDSPGRKARRARRADANVRSAETKLRRRLGTKIRIVPSSHTSGGRIEIVYYDDRDLVRLYNLLMAEPAPRDGAGNLR